MNQQQQQKHVSLFRGKFWASKVMYRGSATDFWLCRGFVQTRESYRKSHRKLTTHIWSIFFGLVLVACRKLSSSEGAPAGEGFGRSAEQNRGLGGDIRLKSGPYLLLFLLLNGGRPGSGRPSTTLENLLPQERYQLVADKSLQCLPCATQMHTRR